MNPLQRYFRNPELFITLPSKGRWWTESSLVVPPNNEIGICSMTGADDLALRNADGLMNGDATVKVIESCCNSIKNAWDMPSIDIDTVFIAIRIASYGHQMDMTTRCNKCNELIEYAVDLRIILQQIQIPNFDNPLVIDDLIIYLKPPSYKITNINNQESFQQQKVIFSLKDRSLSEEEKTRIIREALAKLTDITVSRMHEYIDKIVLPTGESVTNSNFIKEFIANADRKTFDTINNTIQNKMKEYKLPTIPVKCDACSHEDTRELVFEPSSFFAQSS